MAEIIVSGIEKSFEQDRVVLDNVSFQVEAGERVAQLVIAPFLKAEFEEADELSGTVRGEGGFGSTGTV